MSSNNEPVGYLYGREPFDDAKVDTGKPTIE